jgi:hypothetical protein
MDSYIYADSRNTISHTKDERKQFAYSSPTLIHPRGIDVDIEGNIFFQETEYQSGCPMHCVLREEKLQY